MYSLSHIARPISGYEIARLQPRNASHTGDPTTRFLYRLASRLLYRLTQPATNPRGQFRLNISTFKPIFSQMNNLTQGYSLGVRLAHISATIVLLLLFATGARLAWFDQGFFSHEVSNLVDWLAPTGRVVLFHVVLGITFVAIGMFHQEDFLPAFPGSRPDLFSDWCDALLWAIRWPRWLHLYEVSPLLLFALPNGVRYSTYL